MGMRDDDARPDRRRRRPLIEAFVSVDSFGSVFVAIAISYLAAVTLDQEWGASVVLLIQVVTVALALHVSRARPIAIRFATVAVVLAVAAALANLVGVVDGTLQGLVFLAACVLYLLAPLSILRAIVGRPVVDQETVLGAIDAYLLVGMFFAFAYMGVAAVQSEPFFGVTDPGAAGFLFFSFTTLTTTGYGNLVPAGNPGQTMAVAEMLVGQLFLVTAVAKVINAWQPKRWRPAEGADAGASGTGEPDDERKGG
jgi:hypothetical protein